jgi:hypothetical protein
MQMSDSLQAACVVGRTRAVQGCQHYPTPDLSLWLYRDMTAGPQVPRESGLCSGSKVVPKAYGGVDV